MIKRKCLVCGVELIKRNREGYRDWNKRQFCSRKCFFKTLKGKPNKGISENARINPNYGMRGKRHTDETKKKISQSKLGTKLSKETCRKMSLRWVNSESNHHGYVLVLQRNHPFATKAGRVRRSHLVTEKCIGRYLTPEEVVHHINTVKNDDRPKNLYLFPSKSKHTSFEGLKNKPKLISNL